jgi:chromosome segregation ATPase
MDFKEAVGAILAAIVLMVPAVKWLIKDWAKKAEELENQKELNRKTSLSRFENDIKDFRTSVDKIEASMKELNAALVQNRSDVVLLKERFDDLKKNLEKYETNFDNVIANKIKTEVTNLTQQLMLIRNKKNGV